MPLVIGEIVRRHAAVVPDRCAYVFRGEHGARREVTYGELDRSVNRLAHGLAELGLRRGDTLAVLMFNHPAYPIVNFAASKLGVVLVPVNFRYRDHEVLDLVRTARPRALVVEGALLPRVASIPDRVPGAPELIVVDGEPDGAGVGFEELCAGRSEREPGVPVDERDPHIVFFTSGSTGAPKGVVHTHRAYRLQATQPVMSPRGTGEFDTGLCMFPFFHMSGWATSLCYWHARSTVVLLRTPSPVEILDAIESESVTHFNTIPEVLRDICTTDDITTRDLSSLECVYSGTSKMSSDDAALFVDRLPVEGIGVHYGSSEVGPVLVLQPPDAPCRPTSVGRPVIDTDVRLVDESGRDVPPGVPGEVVVRSELVMEGYFEDPEATAAVKDDGWVHTQDLAVVDEDGFYHIVGRLKEVIRSAGETIHPDEVEECIRSLPGVEECAVLGVPDHRFTEVPMAVIACERDGALSEDAVVSHCRARLAPFKRPRHVRFVDALPRAEGTRKVLKSELRERFEAEVSGT